MINPSRRILCLFGIHSWKYFVNQPVFLKRECRWCPKIQESGYDSVYGFSGWNTITRDRVHVVQEKK